MTNTVKQSPSIINQSLASAPRRGTKPFNQLNNSIASAPQGVKEVKHQPGATSLYNKQGGKAASHNIISNKCTNKKSYLSIFKKLPLAKPEASPEKVIGTTIQPGAADGAIINKITPLESPANKYGRDAANPYSAEYWRKQLIDTVRAAKKHNRVDLLEHLVTEAYKDNNVLIALVKKLVPDKTELSGGENFRGLLLADFQKRQEILKDKKIS